MADGLDIQVFCDGVDDVKLFNRIKKLHASLSSIPDENVVVYPQFTNKGSINEKYNAIRPLFMYDRPDFIICIHSNPVLVIEVTEHAYTGDNGLQRFARGASAAENKVDYIYFGPKARVRDDELDMSDDVSKLSKRSLTSDFFVGMEKLAKIFATNQIFCEWKTGSNGKVLKVPLTRDDRLISSVYGELVEKICTIILPVLSSEDKTNREKALKQYRLELKELATEDNTNISDVKFILKEQQVRRLILNPKALLKHVPKDYFFKGKPDKLLAYFAIDNSSVKNIVLPDGDVITNRKEISVILDKIIKSNYFANGAIGYYSGYKWRSDPHCGVAINIYYRMCVQENFEMPLLLFYPRISIQRSSTSSLTNNSKSAEMKNLFLDRYGSEGRKKHGRTMSSNNVFGTWSSTVKQGRLFVDYCSIVFCHDGLVLGAKMREIVRD